MAKDEIFGPFRPRPPLDPALVELHAAVPEDWREVPLPAWLQSHGDHLFAHRSERARLYRYVTLWEDGTGQEMWSVYVTSPDKPDATCVKLDLALSLYARFKKTEFMPKGNLLPWRT